VPLFKDMKNKTALDYALNYKRDGEVVIRKKDSKLQNSNLFSKISGNNQTSDEFDTDETIYRKSADLILHQVGKYPFGLFKVELNHILPKIIDE